jgi:hypothetical protein
MSNARMSPGAIAAVGVLIGAFGMGFALYDGHRVTVALCGVVWGSMLTLAAFVWSSRSRNGLM